MTDHLKSGDTIFQFSEEWSVSWEYSPFIIITVNCLSFGFETFRPFVVFENEVR